MVSRVVGVGSTVVIVGSGVVVVGNEVVVMGGWGRKVEGGRVEVQERRLVSSKNCDLKFVNYFVVGTQERCYLVFSMLKKKPECTH